VRGPESRPQRIGPHDQRDRAIPSRHTLPCILLQLDVAFCLFETPCNGPSAAGDLHHRFPPRRLRGKHHVRCALRRVGQTPAYHKPPTPGRLQRRGQGEPPPIIPARAFRPIASAQPGPALSPQGRQKSFALVLPTSTPDIFFSRDGQDMGVVVCLPPPPQRPIVPLDTLSCHPRGWDARVQGTLEPLLRQLRRGRQEALRWHPRTLAARGVVGPLCGEREGPIEHARTLGTRIGQKHPNLALFNTACCPTLWARHPGRMLAFFQASRLSDDQHGLRVPQRLSHLGPPIVAEGIGIPLRPSQQMRHPIRGALPMDCGQLPPVFALDRPQQTPKICPPSAPSFMAGKTWQDAAVNFGQPDGPGPHRPDSSVNFWLTMRPTSSTS